MIAVAILADMAASPLAPIASLASELSVPSTSIRFLQKFDAVYYLPTVLRVVRSELTPKNLSMKLTNCTDVVRSELTPKNLSSTDETYELFEVSSGPS